MTPSPIASPSSALEFVPGNDSLHEARPKANREANTNGSARTDTIYQLTMAERDPASCRVIPFLMSLNGEAFLARSEPEGRA